MPAIATTFPHLNTRLDSGIESSQNFRDIINGLTDGTKDITVASVNGATLSGSNTGDVTLAAVGAVPNGNAASLSGQQLTLQPADATNPGVLTAGAQNIGGAKSFASTISATQGTFNSVIVGSAANRISGLATIINGAATLTLPASTATLATLTLSETFTNKTLTSPVINTPTGIVKGDVGLGNVDNTSDATKNAASVTLTNKTITSATFTGTHVIGAALDFSAASGGNALITATNGTASGSMGLVLATADATGDAYLRYVITGGLTWCVGGDGSDGDKFKIANNTVPGNNDYFTIDINGVVQLGNQSTNYLEIRNQANPGAVTDGIRIGSVDISADNATLSLRTETALVTESVTSNRTLTIFHNGTQIKVCCNV